MYRNKPAGYFHKSVLKIMTGGAVAFCLFEYFNGNEKFHRNIAMKLVHKVFDPETAHRVGVLTAKYRLYPLKGSMFERHSELQVKVFDRVFDNPIGLAAGFDKNGEALSGLTKSGFGFIEIGSVTPYAQSGNEKPRVFRLSEDEAVINRYGFNSSGHSVVVERLKHFRTGSKVFNNPCFVGVNLGKNKSSTDGDADYSQGFMTFVAYADYIVINISSPNTPGLRDLQRKKDLEKLLTVMKKTRDTVDPAFKKVPLLLKVSPDLSYQEKVDIAVVCNDKKYGVNGLIVSNTTISRSAALKSEFKNEIGGLSGKPLMSLSTQCVKDFRKLTKGQIPIVASGGISTGADAYEKIRAGATLVQLYTALVYQGYPVVGRIKRELVKCLQRDGFSNVSEAVGVDCPI